VTGERGIGKTSTANQLIYVTQGERYLIDSLGIDTGDYRFSYLTVDHRCIPGHTVEDNDCHRFAFGLLNWIVG